MSVELNAINLGYALNSFSNSMIGHWKENASNVTEAIKMLTRVDDVSRLGADELRQALQTLHVFPEEGNHTEQLVTGFDFQQKKVVSTKPDPFFKKGFSSSTVTMKKLIHGSKLEDLLKRNFTLEKQPKLLELSRECNSALLASTFFNYLYREFVSTDKEGNKQLVIESLKKQTQNKFTESHYNDAFKELRDFRASLENNDPIIDTTLRLIAHLQYDTFKNNDVGTKMSLIRDPDLTDNAPYLDLASGILSVQFINSFFSSENDRTFFLNDNSPLVKRFLEVFQEEWGITFEPRVKLITHDLKDFDRDIQDGSIGTLRVNNIYSFCEESQYKDLFQKANRILMPRGKIVFGLRHDHNMTKPQDIDLTNFKDPKFGILGYQQDHYNSALVRLVDRLFKEARAQGWDIKIGSTAGPDDHFEEGLSGAYFSELKHLTTDLVFVKPAA